MNFNTAILAGRWAFHWGLSLSYTAVSLQLGGFSVEDSSGESLQYRDFLTGILTVWEFFLNSLSL